MDEIVDDIVDDIEESNTDNSIEVFNTLKAENPHEVINALQNQKILDTAKNDEEVGKRLEENAKKVINIQLDTLQKQTEKDNQQASFSVNEMACGLYGVNEDCKKWQQRLMTLGTAFWFIIYWIIASVSIVPIHFFIKMIGGIIKKNWVTCLIAIIFYVIILLLVVGTPILISQLN